MKIGTAKRFTMPDRRSFLRGYGDRNSLSRGVEEPVEVGVMALSGGDERIILLITADMVGIPKRQCEMVYGRITERFGIPADRIWLCSTHTHFAPGFEGYFITERGGELEFGDHPADNVYQELWTDRALDAIDAATKSMRECHVEHVQFEAPGIMFNRRTIRKSDGMVEMNWEYPANDGEFLFQKCDPLMSAWKFVTGEGPAAILGCVGCHPVTGGRDGYLVSGDYPWYFRRKIEELYGCPGFFMLGAAGDSVPRLRGPGSQKFNPKINSRKNIGEILALTLQQNEMLFRRDASQTVAMKVAEVPVSLPPELDFENADRNYFQAEKNQSPDRDFHFRSREIAKFYSGRNFTMPLRLLRLGDKVLTGMPFEVLSGISLGLRDANPDAVLVSITGGFNGYLPLSGDFPAGGYESSYGATHFPKGTGEKFMERAIEESLKF